MKKRNLAALVTAGAMCLGLLAGCGGQAENTPAGTNSDPAGETSSAGTAGGTFKVGFIGPLTGPNASYGNSASQGAQIAVNEINALGGAIQFELRVQDDV